MLRWGIELIRFHDLTDSKIVVKSFLRNNASEHSTTATTPTSVVYFGWIQPGGGGGRMWRLVKTSMYEHRL